MFYTSPCQISCQISCHNMLLFILRPRVLLPCYQDGTQDFEDISHSDSAREWANKHLCRFGAFFVEYLLYLLRNCFHSAPRNMNISGHMAYCIILQRLWKLHLSGSSDLKCRLFFAWSVGDSAFTPFQAGHWLYGGCGRRRGRAENEAHSKALRGMETFTFDHELDIFSHHTLPKHHVTIC